MHESLSKALKNEFYYEAIFIEYAILEDRLTSALIQECRAWTDERNSLIHHMANLPYDSEKGSADCYCWKRTREAGKE